MKFRTTITIELPRERMVRLFDDPSTMTERQPSLISFEPVSGGGTELEREYRDWLPLVPNVGVLWKF